MTEPQVTASAEYRSGKGSHDENFPVASVLVRKRHGRAVAELTPDFIGLDVPDRYVFGCGMDYKNYLRNLPAIYAVRG